LTDAAGKLSGLFTDSDLARLFETRRDQSLDRPIHEVMTHQPATVPQGSMTTDAVAIMAERKISELPVIDNFDKPWGLIDITDVVSLFPEIAWNATGESAAAPVSVPIVAHFPSSAGSLDRTPQAGAPPRDCA